MIGRNNFYRKFSPWIPSWTITTGAQTKALCFLNVHVNCQDKCWTIDWSSMLIMHYDFDDINALKCFRIYKFSNKPRLMLIIKFRSSKNPSDQLLYYVLIDNFSVYESNWNKWKMKLRFLFTLWDLKFAFCAPNAIPFLLWTLLLLVCPSNNSIRGRKIVLH